MVSPDHGEVSILGGTRVAWAPQEPVLAPDLAAAEWIFLGRELRGPLRFTRRGEMREQAARALGEVGSSVGPDARLGALASAQRKQVQLARALWGMPEALLLDEPTAALGTAEAERLFEVLRRRRAAGAGILYVTHRLSEIAALADRVTVLRDGRHISTDRVGEIDAATLVRRMVGRDLSGQVSTGREPGSTVLEVEDLAVAHVIDVSLCVREGEIVGLAGLVGAGRSEVLEAIAGLRRLVAGHVECASPPVLVPEDRGAKGLIPTFGVRENVCLPADSVWLDRSRERDETEFWLRELAIRATGSEAPVESLSGGNQQKLLLARALRRRPALLLLDEPTAGVDVGAKAEIHDLVRRLGESGTGVLLASSDLPELLSLCDRIVALRAGRVVGEVAGAEASEDRVGAMITGMH
jgi:rhamnose transport system ATP-binding protein